MSLINKMLQDLDQRHAADGAGKGLTQQLRPVKSPRSYKRILWEVGAGLLIGGGWLAWVLYQVEPRSLVTDLAAQMQAKRAPRPLGAQSPLAQLPLAPVPAQPPVAPAVPPGAAPVASAPPSAPAQTVRPPEFAAADMLKLATEIVTPIRPRTAESKSKGEGARASAAPPRVEMAKSDAERGVPPAAAPETATSIEKRAHQATPAERAEGEFRRATALLAEGRVAEAMDGYKSALRQDSGHGAARQALVGLLLDGKRVDEAQFFLQDGLKQDPNRATYAMLLARIQVERGDLPGAHELLRKHAGGAADNAGFHALDAAVLQRMGRHKDAIGAYETALKLAPQAGLWWMGLGISLQAAQRGPDALGAFQRAKAVGGLNAELVAFVDQRIKQLQ